MKRRLYVGLLVLGLIFALSGCNKKPPAAGTENPLQFEEAPVEAQTFDWSQVATDPGTLAQGLDNYPSAVSDWTAEGLNLETGGELPAFNFGEDSTQYQSVESDPNEIPLENGMPLEGSNNDPALGQGNQFPNLQTNTNAEGSDNTGEEGNPVVTPTPEPTPEPTAPPAESGDSESLAKTADVPLVVYALLGLVTLTILIAVLKKSSQVNH